MQMEWPVRLLYAALGLWALSMALFGWFWIKRISLMQRLGLIEKEKKKKDRLPARIAALVFRWSEGLTPLGRRFKLFASDELLERRLALAGHPHGLTLDTFYGFRFLCLFAGLLVGTMLSLIGFSSIFVLLLFGLGLVWPSLWLRSAATGRQEQIGVDLPDFMDAMSVTLQAGVPLDPAMKQIVRTMEGPLREELSRFQQELDIGVPREQAYMRLMDRNQSKPLEMLILSLLQGSRLGVPISSTFKTLAEDMRDVRVSAVKERAAKAGPKVTLITTFVILPGVILFIVGMLVLNFIYNPEGIGFSWDGLNGL